MQGREEGFATAAVKVEHCSPPSTPELPRAYTFRQLLGSPSQLPLRCWRQSCGSDKSAGSAEMMHKVEAYLEALQDERRKIEAFKRELPLCMELLDHAIGSSKEQLSNNRPFKASAGGSESCEGREASVIQCSSGPPPLADGVTPVTAKWDNLRTERHEEKDKQQKNNSAASNKPSWMVEGQLWDRPSSDASRRQEKESTLTQEIRLRAGDAETEQVTSSSPRLELSSRQRPAGAFLPFIRERPSARPMSTHSDAAACNGTDLSLSSPGDCELTSASARSPSVSGVGVGLEEVGSMDGSVVRQRKQVAAQVQTAEVLSGMEGAPAGSTTTSSSGQANRKARRCWSPELHRRFVGALQQLGGAQVATPKQIRELMKVDGLTNDEVKSHLQKYRLHTRRPSPVPQAAGGQAPQLVVLGGIWMPPEYAAAAAAAAAQQSSPQGISGVPPFCPPALSTQEYYSHLSHQSPQLQLRQPPYYEQQQAASQTQSSPNEPKLASSPRDCANSNHSYADDSAGEEGKSDSTSWKGANGVHEDDGEEGDMTIARKNFSLHPSDKDGKPSASSDMEEDKTENLQIAL